MISKTIELGICLRYSCMLEIEDGCERGLKADLLADERVKDRQTWGSQLAAEGSRHDLLWRAGHNEESAPVAMETLFRETE